MPQPTRTKVGPRGRVTVPVAIQRAAGLTEGDEVIITVVRPGVVTIETPDANLEAFRAAIPPDADRASYDAAADVRALRDADTERLDRLTPRSDQGQPTPGAGPPQ